MVTARALNQPTQSRLPSWVACLERQIRVVVGTFAFLFFGIRSLGFAPFN